MKSARPASTAASLSAAALLTTAILLQSVSSSPLALPFPEGENPDGTKYQTAYRCEGQTLEITCESRDAVIEVVRANYGRFSIAICNRNGFTDWSVNCMAPKTKRVLKEKCDMKRSCRMPVNSAVFGDPCPGTHKYVEVHYACKNKAAASSTKKPLPPWFLESGAGDIWSQNKNSNGGAVAEETVPPTASSSSSSSTATSSSTRSDPTTTSTTNKRRTPPPRRRPILVTQPTTPVRIPITTPRPSTTTGKATSTEKVAAEGGGEKRLRVAGGGSGRLPKGSADEDLPAVNAHSPRTGSGSIPDVEVIVSDIPRNTLGYNNGNGGGFMANHCQPTFRRSVHWNWTAAGQVAIVPCPYGATGLARWACVEAEVGSGAQTGAEWAGLQPDMSDCKSNAMAQLEMNVREEEPENAIASTMASLTGGRRALFGGDLETASSVLRTVATRLQYLLQTQSFRHGGKERYVSAVFGDVVRSVSNLLSRRQRVAWNDLHISRQMGVATSLLRSLEESAFLVADVARDGEEYLEEATREIAVAISITRNPTASRTFPIPGLQFSRIFGNLSDRIVVLSDGDHGDHIRRAVFFAYNGLHEILGEAEQNVRWNSGADDDDFARRPLILNSHVISASLAMGRHKQLLRKADRVRVTLRHLRTENVSDPLCVFWDYEHSAWSDDGCEVVSDASDDQETVCQCDHLTNFALLMAEGNGDEGALAAATGGVDNGVIALQVFSYVVVILAILCLVAVAYKFRSKITHVLSKYASGEKKVLDHQVTPAAPGCPKSSSFYTGVNLVPVSMAGMATVGNSRQSTTTAAAAAAMAANGSKTMGPNLAAEDPTRLSQYLVQYQLPANDPEFLHQQQQQQQQQHFAATLRLNSSPHHYTTTSVISESESGQNIYSKRIADDGMEATRHLRDSVYMSPQLMQLTNTLRSKKKVCQGGHNNCGGHNDDTMLPEKEVVFRAVSPHGHVYWEIDPKRDLTNAAAAGPIATSDDDERNMPSQTTSSSDMSSSRQSSSRYSGDSHHPLIDDNQGHVLVNPFVDVQLLPASPRFAEWREVTSASASPTARQQQQQPQQHSSLAAFNSLRAGKPKLRAQLANNFGTRSNSQRGSGGGHKRGKERRGAADSPVTEQLQTQVQIRDLRSIPVSIKSNEYILAKIQSHLNGSGSSRASPDIELRLSSASSPRESPRQRKV